MKSVKFNGRDLCGFYNLKATKLEINGDKKFGASRTLNINNKKVVEIEEDDTFELEITFIKDNYSKITDVEFTDIARLLFKKEIGVLQIGNKCYYGAFIEGSVNNFVKNRNYFTVTFECASPYAYTPIYQDSITIRELEKIITYDNFGVNDVYLHMGIECKADGRFTFSNRFGDSLYVDMVVGDTVELVGDTKDVIGNNIVGTLDVLKLVVGINDITMNSTGLFKVITQYQCELPLIEE